MMPDNPKLLVPDWTKELPLEEMTLAELFKKAGYATASIGKWHLGGETFSPERQGFDINLGGTDKAAPPSYHSPYRIPNLPDGPEGEYLTDRLGEEAAQRIAAWRDGPFFLYLPHFAVHTPIQGARICWPSIKRNPAPVCATPTRTMPPWWRASTPPWAVCSPRSTCMVSRSAPS